MIDKFFWKVTKIPCQMYSYLSVGWRTGYSLIPRTVNILAARSCKFCLLTVVPDSDMLPSLSVDGTQLYNYCLSLLETGGLWIVNAYWIEFFLCQYIERHAGC